MIAMHRVKELENFHGVLSDISYGRSTERVKDRPSESRYSPEHMCLACHCRGVRFALPQRGVYGGGLREGRALRECPAC